jgi:UDP-3-O-[3-hydroxymyristoyl] glucosamine N-acyltransferase
VASHRYLARARESAAGALLVATGTEALDRDVLVVGDPHEALADLLPLFEVRREAEPGVHPTAVVASGALVDPSASVGPHAVIGAGSALGPRVVVHAHVVIGADCRLGAGSVLYPGVVLYDRTQVGERCLLHSGVVVGADGYGYASRSGEHRKLAHLGRVVIEDDVEIGANTAIDRPAVGETRIGAGAKIDNLVQVAHGVRIGANALIAAQTGIAGSTVLGRNVVLAGQVGVAGHIDIGDGARATAQTGIPNSVAPGALVSGYPAIDNREWLRASAVFRRLPDLKRRVSALADRLTAIEAALARSGPPPVP